MDTASLKSANWSLAEDLSFHKIWFKFVNNFVRYPANKQTDKTDSGYHSTSATAWQR